MERLTNEKASLVALRRLVHCWVLCVRGADWRSVGWIGFTWWHFDWPS
jgi:hypothetical protein